MILLLDSDPDRLVDISEGLTGTGQAVLGLTRADVAARVMDRAGAALVVLSDMVSGWRQFVGREGAPVLLVTSDPSGVAAEGAAAALGTGLGSGPILQMARALLSGGGEMSVAPVAALGAPDEARPPAAALPPRGLGIVTDPGLPDAGEGDEGAAAWRGLGARAAAQDRAIRHAARTDAAAAADYARRVAEERRRALARRMAEAEEGRPDPLDSRRTEGPAARPLAPLEPPMLEAAPVAAERVPPRQEPMEEAIRTGADQADALPAPVFPVDMALAPPADLQPAQDGGPFADPAGVAPLPAAVPAPATTTRPRLAAAARQAAIDAFSAALAASAAARTHPPASSVPTQPGAGPEAVPQRTTPPIRAATPPQQASEASRPAPPPETPAPVPQPVARPAEPPPAATPRPAIAGPAAVEPPPTARQLRPATLVEFDAGQLVPVAPKPSTQIHPPRRVGEAGASRTRGAA